MKPGLTKRQRAALARALDRAECEGVCSRCKQPLVEGETYRVFQVRRGRAYCCDVLEPGAWGYTLLRVPSNGLGSHRIQSTTKARDIKATVEPSDDPTKFRMTLRGVTYIQC